LVYVIISTEDTTNEAEIFSKKDFESQFELCNYNEHEAYVDSKKLSSLQLQSIDLEKDVFHITNVFSSFNYQNELFVISWNKRLLSTILNLKISVNLTDFKSQ